MLLRLAAVALTGAAIAASSHAAETPRENGLPFLQHFDRRDYRGHAQVWAGAVDADGLLYFGNYAQILVYDGVQWDRIAVPGATFVRALAFDSRGRLWVGGLGAIGYIDTTAPVPTFISLAEKLPTSARGPGDIARVLVLGDSVYFQSAAWLFRWRADAFEGWPLPPGPPTQSLIVDGELLLQSPFSGWRRIGPQGLEPAPTTLPRLAPTRFALPLTGERWLLGTIFNGLYVAHASGSAPLYTEADALLRSKFLFNALQLRDGSVALGTLTGGAVILSPDLKFKAAIDGTAGLPSLAVNNIFTDIHGGLWLCLGDGVARVADSLAVTWFRPPSPFGRIDTDALIRFGGQLYLGVAPELRALVPSKETGAATWEIRQVLGARQGGRIGALLEAGDTMLVAAGDGCYLWKEQDIAERMVAFRGGSALLASTAQPNRYFVGHAAGIETLRRNGAQWLAEGPLAGVNGDVHSLHEDADGIVWAGLAHGEVLRLTFAPGTPAPRVETFTAAHGLPAGDGGIRVMRADDRPLFATAAGLYRFDAAQNRFTPETRYGARFADGSTRARALAENARGDLWIAPQRTGPVQPWSETTLGRATRSGEWHVLPASDLSRIGDIVGLRLEQAGDREILWAVGVSGLVRIELDALPPLPPAGATLLRAVTPLDDPTPLLADSRTTTTLPYAKNSLRFRVAAPGLAAMTDLQFETEIVGLGDGARYLSASAERELTHLWEGDYVFRARARAADGRVTTPVEFAFTILPPWWRTRWAMAGYALGAVLGIAGIFRFRTRALRRRAAQLSATVAEHTVELQARNQELTRLHQLELDEKISARLAEEKARLEMLRYQLNPHFLFNTLNSLYALVEDHPAASDMVLRLSEFCRLTLMRGADSTQTLGDELQVLSTYLDIEKVRWGESLRVTIDAEPAARARHILPFLLLPLVENAIKHGGETSPALLQVRLNARVIDDALAIEVANTGRWLAPGTSPARSTHVGLENLRERLRRIYANAHRLAVEERDGWVSVTLVLSSSAFADPADQPGGAPGREERNRSANA